MSDETTDEFGAIDVFSEARLAKIKGKANEEFTAMANIIKRSETALGGIVEWLKITEKNERAFYATSQMYVDTLKAIEAENLKCKF